MPSGLPGGLEALILLAVAMRMFEIRPVLWASTVVGAIHFLDDWVDRDTPHLGPLPLLLGGSLSAFAWTLAPMWTGFGLLIGLALMGPFAGCRIGEVGADVSKYRS